MAVKSSTISALIVFLALLSLSHFSHGELRLKFYNETCSNVEQVVFGVVEKAFRTNSRLAPLMIRLYFHDCFSNGCDASLLLDGTNSEKTAGPNLSVDGYALIDAVKDELESKCEGVVSCADIIALVTRDLVHLASGRKARYEIPTGRFDGRESLASSVDLPGPRMSVSDTFKMFEKRKLSLTDMVLLLGGHTIGEAHCSFIMDRLYNFKNTGKPDPSMDPTFVKQLSEKCPKNSSADGVVNLDQNVSSSNVVDSSFYKQIKSRRGILHIDQLLATDKMTSKIVMDLADGNDFLARFGRAMVNLGSFGVKDKGTGEIRTSCRACKNLFCTA
ncbi:Peroxidase 60 [Hirschfeldia incana]|nr:Peroxidase 60 [Hirschfeldia incana]